MQLARVLLLLGLTLSTQHVSAEVFRFLNGRVPGNIDQVTAQLKVGGDILEARDGKVNRVRLGVLADLEYDEKTLGVGEGPHRQARSVRKYRRVEATIRVGDDVLRPTLRPEASLVAAAVDNRRSILFSPKNPLSRDELETIDIVGNSLLLDRLVPDGPLKVGQTWQPAASLLAQLLGLDSVGASDIQCELVEVADAVARFQMTGSLAATIHGIATRIQLKGKYRYDRRTRRIDWFALSTKEVRAIAPVSEGFDVVAQVQIRIVPQANATAFDDGSLEGLPLEPRDELEMLSYRSTDGNWQMAHNRNWFVIRDDPDLVILRLIQQGESLAQCSISSLPVVPVDKLPTLERFQEDVRQALGDGFERFVSAGQWANEAKYRVYRVAVSGTAHAELKQATAKVPIEWRYYLVADGQGRRIVFATTVEAELAERLGNADRELVETFRFTEPAPAPRKNP
jgi:hypothetical protein